MTALNLSAPTPDASKQRLAAARRQYAEQIDKPLECLAKQRGDLVTERHRIDARLTVISLRPGPNNRIIDPADRDPKLRDERCALEDRLERTEAEIEAIDVKRRGIESTAADWRNKIEQLEYDVDAEEGRSSISSLVTAALSFTECCSSSEQIIQRLQAKYPAHRTVGNTTLYAYARMPAIVGLLRTLPEGVRMLLEPLALWDPRMFAADAPERKRAEQIVSAEKHAANAGNAVQRNRIEQLRAEEQRRETAARRPTPSPNRRNAVDLLRDSDEAIRVRQQATSE